MDSFWLAENPGEDIGTNDNFSNSNNCFHQPSNRPQPLQPTNATRYLNELVMELGELNDIEIEYPGLLVHIPILLTAELSKIWDLLYNEPFGNQMDSFENKWQSQTLEETNVTLQEKIALSKEQSADYGRRANSLRYSLLKRLENETSCQILIRGRGSLLNYRLESRLKNYAGWEHLSEPLHLLVRANDSTITLCLMKLARGVRHVKRYLARRQRNEMREK